MKKCFLVLTVAALAFVLASPAMADLKLTTSGRMDVTGIYLSENIINWSAADESDSSNAWYQMELVIDPVLHINDKVRIHGRVTVMERNWRGGHGAENDTNSFGIGGAGGRGGNYRAEHNWWWERLYLSFPLMGGTMYVGRMGGGGWAYPFQDSDSNRDRIKYVRKFGHILLVGLVEKLGEGDGGDFLTTNPANGDSWDQSASDVDAYAVGSVIPFSKSIVYKPLLYHINWQDPVPDKLTAFMNGLMLKFGNFQLDTELNYWWFDMGDHPTIDNRDMFSWWLDAGLKMGPAEFGGGFFWIPGDDDATDDEQVGLLGVGEDFEPYFLFFSEDVGLFWDSGGVASGNGVSGFQSAYLRGSFNITDTMKIGGVLGYLRADEMEVAGDPDEEFGWEFDLNLEWKFMDNIAYVVDAGYLKAGDYWDDISDGEDNDVWGVRHMLVINW